MLKREGLWLPMALLMVSLCALVGIGSFGDRAISGFLYAGRESLFGGVLAVLGELPAFTLFAMAGTVWLRRRGRSRRWKELLALLGGVGLVLLGGAMTCREILENFPRLSLVDGAVISVCVIAAAAVAGLLLTRSASRADCCRFVLSVLFVCGLAMVSTHFLKYLWARPRPWYLFQESGVSFVPWWRPGVGRFPADAPFKAHRSFPSGHTATAACSLLWTLFPTLHRRFEGQGRIWFCFSCFLTALVALSRLTLGAHFLSDVSLTWLLVCLLYLLSQFLFYRDGVLFRTLYRFLT